MKTGEALKGIFQHIVAAYREGANLEVAADGSTRVVVKEICRFEGVADKLQMVRLSEATGDGWRPVEIGAMKVLVREVSDVEA